MEPWSRRLAVLACLVALGGAAAAQISLQHGFPVAGDVLTLVVDGADPDGVDLTLDAFPEAPPSIVEAFAANETRRVDGTALVTTWLPDAAGRVRFDVPLDHDGDAGAPIRLAASTPGRPDEAARIELMVVPPTVVVETSVGYERIDLRSGTCLAPPIPGGAELRGLAVSADGTETYALYADGRLETWSGQAWSPAPRDVAFLDPDSDGLAAAPHGGVSFVLARSDARPFSPNGRLLFPEDGPASLILEPMGDDVSGRRWAIGGDGLVAFVAEDYLNVRQVDLLHRELGALFTAGRGGDFTIADLALDAERLYVVTRSVDARPGSLTTYDLRSGITDVVGLTTDPREVVVLDGGVALVVPEGDARIDVVVDGVLATAMTAEGGAWLDATALPGASLLLRRDAAGRHALLRYDVASGVVATLADGLPPVTRVVTQSGADDGHAILLGDPSGQVWSYDLEVGTTAPVADVVIDPRARALRLP